MQSQARALPVICDEITLTDFRAAVVQNVTHRICDTMTVYRPRHRLVICSVGSFGDPYRRFIPFLFRLTVRRIRTWGAEMNCFPSQTDHRKRRSLNRSGRTRHINL